MLRVFKVGDVSALKGVDRSAPNLVGTLSDRRYAPG